MAEFGNDQEPAPILPRLTVDWTAKDQARRLVNAIQTLAQWTVAGVTGGPGACARCHAVQEYKPGHEHAPIHSQLMEESNVSDQAGRRGLATQMVAQ